MLTHIQKIVKLREYFKVPKDKVGPEAFRDLGFINLLELKLTDDQYFEFCLKLDMVSKRTYSASVDERQEALCRTLFPESYIGDLG